MDGFPLAALVFLDDLKANNTRDWFMANKAVYETEVKQPALEFSEAVANALGDLTGRAHSAKLFRVHRDVRFSKDKTPYNAHLHISFTPESSLTSPPMWFFGLGTDSLSLGCGVFGFEKADLEAYRARVTGAQGSRLAGVLEALQEAGARIGEPALKRVPNGYPKDHPRADLLRHKGLTCWLDHADRNWVTKPGVVSGCVDEFRKLQPVFNILIDH